MVVRAGSPIGERGAGRAMVRVRDPLLEREFERIDGVETLRVSGVKIGGQLGGGAK